MEADLYIKKIGIENLITGWVEEFSKVIESTAINGKFSQQIRIKCGLP